MRLNIECIRDVLLTSEEETNLNNEVLNIDELVTMQRIKKYDEDDIIYKIKKNKRKNKIINKNKLVTIQKQKKYDEDDIIYTIKKLKEANYIEADVLIHSEGSMAMIRHLTYEGHLFLANIRDDGIWKKTKKEASKISSSVSINILSNIAIKLSSLY